MEIKCSTGSVIYKSSISVTMLDKWCSIKAPTDHENHLAKGPNDEDGSEDPVRKEMQREEKQISLAEEQL